MLWETVPHSRRQTVCSEGHTVCHSSRSGLSGILINTYASGSSLYTPSSLTPLWTVSLHPQFSTPTILSPSICQDVQPGCADKPTPHYSPLLAGPEKAVLFRTLLLGYKPSWAQDPFLPLPWKRFTHTGTVLRSCPCQGALWLCQAFTHSPELLCNQDSPKQEELLRKFWSFFCRKSWERKK